MAKKSKQGNSKRLTNELIGIVEAGYQVKFHGDKVLLTLIFGD